MLFDTIYKKMEKELSDRKKMMANVIEVRYSPLCIYRSDYISAFANQAY